LLLFSVTVGTKGTGVNLFKLGAKRRRTKVEVQEAKEEERLRQQGVDRQAAQITELTQRLNQIQAEKANGDHAVEILRTFIENG
jgi:hypothetical protein